MDIQYRVIMRFAGVWLDIPGKIGVGDAAAAERARRAQPPDGQLGNLGWQCLAARRVASGRSRARQGRVSAGPGPKWLERPAAPTAERARCAQPDDGQQLDWWLAYARATRT